MGKYEYRKLDDSYCIFFKELDGEREIQIGVIFTEIHAKIMVKMLNKYHSKYITR